MTVIKTRRALASDIEQLSDLFVQLDNFHIRRSPGEFKSLKHPARGVDLIASFLELPGNAVIVAESVPGQVAGLTHVLIRDIPANIVAPKRTIAEMDTLVVHQACRRKGVGSALVAAAKAWAGEMGLPTVELNVRGFNHEAFQFYCRMGFEVAAYRMRTT